jgi:hypothetical protein
MRDCSNSGYGSESKNVYGYASASFLGYCFALLLPVNVGSYAVDIMVPPRTPQTSEDEELPHPE